MSRATSDISESEKFIGIGLMDLVATILLLVGILVAIILENFQLSLYVLGPMLGLVYATLRFGSTIRPIFKDIQKQMGALASTMQESMTDGYWTRQIICARVT